MPETTETHCSIKLVSDCDFGNVRLGLPGNPVNTEDSLVEKFYPVIEKKIHGLCPSLLAWPKKVVSALWLPFFSKN